jgi:hypothetical protein
LTGFVDLNNYASFYNIEGNLMEGWWHKSQTRVKFLILFLKENVNVIHGNEVPDVKMPDYPTPLESLTKYKT